MSRLYEEQMNDEYFGITKSDIAQTLVELERIKKETDPNGIDAKTPGSKLDAGKPPVTRGLLDYFPRGCLEVSRVSAKGAEKYSWKGWESVPDGVNRYLDAAGRHLVYRGIDGETDRDTGLLHLAQLAWNSLAALELYLREKEKND